MAQVSFEAQSKHNNRRTANLCIIASNPRTAAPSTNTNIRLAVRKSSHEPLQLRIILDGAYPHDVAFLIHMHTFFQGCFRAGTSPMPRCVQLLHEERVSLARRGFPNLLNGHVAPGADNVAHIDEIIPHEAILCDLRLLSFKAIVDRDDRTGSPIWCWEDGRCARLDIYCVIVIEAMDFECLVVIGLVVDVDIMHGVGLRVRGYPWNMGFLLFVRMFVLQAQARNKDLYIIFPMDSVAYHRSRILIACLGIE